MVRNTTVSWACERRIAQHCFSQAGLAVGRKPNLRDQQLREGAGTMRRLLLHVYFQSS